MARLCSRPGCSAPAVVTFTFDAPKLTVWVGDLVDDPGAGYDLCQDHGDRLAPPKGWEIADQRSSRPALPTLDANSPMLSRAFRAASG